LNLVPAGIALFEHHGAGELGADKERVPDLHTEDQGGQERQQHGSGRGGGERAPIATRSQRNRNHQPELRLVSHQPE
jgi:hypothetical protein